MSDIRVWRGRYPLSVGVRMCYANDPEYLPDECEPGRWYPEAEAAALEADHAWIEQMRRVVSKALVEQGGYIDADWLLGQFPDAARRAT